MQNRYNALEVIEMAKDIEKRGYEFYTNQAKISKNKDLKELFLKLAKDEKDHYQRFIEISNIISEQTKKEAEYVYDPEVSAYLQSIVEFSVFPADETVKIEDIKEALQLAIYAEKDSILFYQEMLAHNDGQTSLIIEKLIKEEKQHLLELVNYHV
ncbi:ferritin-like domain-containing protein [Natronospora cellulosivora (SeqCode)]